MGSQNDKTLVLCGSSAILFWRAVREGRIAHPEPCSLSYPFAGVHRFRDLEEIDLTTIGVTPTNQGIISLCSERWIQAMDGANPAQQLVFSPQGLGVKPGRLAPLHVLVYPQERGRNNSLFVRHVLFKELPDNSFNRVSENIVVISPALTFTQACLTKRVLPNIELGLEWSGRYALHAPSCPEVRKSNPILCISELDSYVQSLNNMKGVVAAREALPWLTEGLASPRETELYLMLVLPPTLGGFGLPLPRVNATITLQGTRAQSMTSDTYYVVDLLFELGPHDIVRGLVVEYDGAKDHEMRASDIRHDKERRSVLAALGYTVIVVSRSDLCDPIRLRQKAEQIAQVLNITLPALNAEQQSAQAALAGWLFDPNHDHLPFGYGYR